MVCYSVHSTGCFHWFYRDVHSNWALTTAKLEYTSQRCNWWNCTLVYTYQELFQNTQTNSDINKSERCRKIYSWKWYCQNFRTQPTDLSSCSAQERTFSEIPAPQTTITACFTNVRRFYWNSGRSLPCLVHSLTHCNALIRQSTHAFET